MRNDSLGDSVQWVEREAFVACACLREGVVERPSAHKSKTVSFLVPSSFLLLRKHPPSARQPQAHSLIFGRPQVSLECPEPPRARGRAPRARRERVSSRVFQESSSSGDRLRPSVVAGVPPISPTTETLILAQTPSGPAPGPPPVSFEADTRNALRAGARPPGKRARLLSFARGINAKKQQRRQTTKKTSAAHLLAKKINSITENSISPSPAGLRPSRHSPLSSLRSLSKTGRPVASPSADSERRLFERKLPMSQAADFAALDVKGESGATPAAAATTTIALAQRTASSALAAALRNAGPPTGTLWCFLCSELEIEVIRALGL